MGFLNTRRLERQEIPLEQFLLRKSSWRHEGAFNEPHRGPEHVFPHVHVPADGGVLR